MALRGNSNVATSFITHEKCPQIAIPVNSLVIETPKKIIIHISSRIIAKRGLKEYSKNCIMLYMMSVFDQAKRN